jgi:hypothetical protein
VTLLRRGQARAVQSERADPREGVGDLLEGVLVLGAGEVDAGVPLALDYPVPYHDLVDGLRSRCELGRTRASLTHVIRRLILGDKVDEELLGVPVEEWSQVCAGR